MTLILDLPGELESRLQEQADAQNRSREDLALDILSRELGPQGDDELRALVARIKATPPNPACIVPATASLADYLRDAPQDPDFDLQEWQRQWDAVEAEMKAMEHAENRFGGK